MFCSQCGQELNNDVKFCYNCGGRTSQGNENEYDSNAKDDEYETNSSDEQTIIFTINGVEVNMSEIIDKFGSDKIKAIKYLCDITGLGLIDAKNCIDDAYKIYNSQAAPEDQKKSYWQKMQEKGRIELQRQENEKIQSRERLKQMDCEGIAYCPKCHSTSLSAQKKGFGIGKAVIGGLAGVATGGTIGLVGLVAGNAGAKKVRVTCLKCGHQFWAGKK